MIQVGTQLKVADNSGAKLVECIKVPGGSKKRYARLGEIIVVAVKSAAPKSNVKKKSIQKAVIVRMKKETKRRDNTHIRFDDNSVVIVGEDKNPKGTRIFGPVAIELKAQGYNKIVSLAPEVL